MEEKNGAITGGDSAGEETYVCPSCGQVPGGGVHCDACGANLLWRWRLPSRRQWRAVRKPRKPDPSSERGRLRYLPRELRELYKGNADTAQGWLLLTLALNEELKPGETVTCVFSATKPAGMHWWLVVTPGRLLCIPGRSVAFFNRRWLRAFESNAIKDHRDRRRLFGSRFYFRDPKGEQAKFSLRGRDAAAELSKALFGTPKA